MHFLIDVARHEASGGWQVQVVDAAGQRLHDGEGQPLRRLLRRAGAGPLAMPLPPAGDDDAYAGLLADPAPLTTIYDKLVVRTPGPGQIEEFGRYLFDTLIGARAWEAIIARAAGAPLELALRLPMDDPALNRLPWEMMHGPDDFLVALPGLAITRRVPDTASVSLERLDSPPRVLFVIGVGLGNDDIRPGAEYLGLLRGLRYQSLTLNHQLLLEASTERLEVAVRLFRPDVVHIICHGVFDQHGVYLELRDNDNTQLPARVSPEILRDAVRTADNLPLPRVVVLNACFTATVAPGAGGGSQGELRVAGQVTIPFAARLVQLGVPVVSAMAGRVADQACRLFTRSFYESLLAGGELVHHAARGRRAALRHGAGPRASVDWAFPTLFLGEGVPQSVRVEQRPSELQWLEVANNLPTEEPVFCGRLHFLQWLGLLLAPGDSYKGLITRSPAGLQVLAVSTRGADPPGDSGPRFGRGRLLKEMAIFAARHGHVPCLLVHDRRVQKKWHVTPRELMDALVLAAYDTASIFGHAGWWAQVTQTVLDGPDNLPDEYPDPMRHLYARRDETRYYHQVLAMALRADLLDLLDLIRQENGTPEARLLLLVDDVHEMGEAAAFFLHDLLGNSGLRGVRDDVCVVFTSAGQAATGQEPAIELFRDWLQKSPWAQPLTLKPFQPPLEERLAYETYLLHWRDENHARPLVIPHTAQTAAVDVLLGKLRDCFQGIPSYLNVKSHDAQLIISAYIGMLDFLTPENRPLKFADDEDVVRKMIEAGYEPGA
ncbi:MAG TPA: CHAT domain-containing protein [Candidatus Sulfomarinibacteraceae bacterium]|nr:CHAT domain-containing protein [Candidatus Sulfomarinibacteraceae bacterium]